MDGVSKVMVYFNNGMKALFDEDRIAMVYIGAAASQPETRKEIFDRGCAIINWDNVCFIQRMKAREEEA